MASDSNPTYPRPDFERSKLDWQSLNGQWDFLFDDEDVGLSERWHGKGLPSSVTVKVSSEGKSTVEEITEKIAALPENLIKNNVFQKSEADKTYEKRKINVPFVFQTPASGINDKDAHEVLWYERSIEVATSDKLRSLLRFGAVDYEATIWVNGLYVGSHRGGHVPFDVDITDALLASSSATARITIRVRDSPHDLTQPRGKQYWAPQPESIFYTPSSGIWQNVWLERVPSLRLADSSHGTVLRSDDIKNGKLHAEVHVLGKKAGQACAVGIEANISGLVVRLAKADVPKDKSFVKIELAMDVTEEDRQNLPHSLLSNAPLSDENCWRQGVALWSPEHPSLYDIMLRLYDASGELVDDVKTIVGMRSLDWQTGDSTFRLNDKPYFQALVLDQGYWPESGMTPPTTASLKADVELSKAMGFNGCRKHQKVEDPIFLYWADRLGYLVWGEMGNAYQYDDTYVDRFNQEWTESMRRDINHPCIVTWTPVNESWGYTNLKEDVDQRNHIRSLYYLTKTLDPTRPINDNCGWEHVCTDLTTFHDYADAPELTKTCSTLEGILDKKAGRDVFSAALPGKDPGASHRKGAPVLCTEFGGVNVAPAKDDANAGERDWGYTTADDPADLLKRVENLVMAVVKGGHCCGFVYTQLTDIEQEVNGLYSFDRRAKLDVDKVKAIMLEAQKIYLEKHS